MSSGGGEDDEAEEDQPLGDLAAEVEARAAEDDEAVFEEAFDEVDVENLDPETVWADLLTGGGPTAVDPPRAEDDQNRDVRVISKRTCHDCQFFAEPPALHCNHEGTAIREVVDVAHYEVVDCPMVVDSEDVGLE